jgi:hypothetical protein
MRSRARWISGDQANAAKIKAKGGKYSMKASGLEQHQSEQAGQQERVAVRTVMRWCDSPNASAPLIKASSASGELSRSCPVL